jgi:thioredoxin reductase
MRDINRREMMKAALANFGRTPFGTFSGACRNTKEGSMESTTSDRELYKNNQSTIADTVIVGAGPAGLSAALFLSRAGLDPIVFDGGPSRIMVVDKVREFIGYDGMSPKAMLEKMRDEALHYGARIQPSKVEKIAQRDDGLFDVWTSLGTLIAKVVVLATGLVDDLPKISGLSKVWGNDLRVCPCFDGYEFRNQRFVAFGIPQRLPHFGAWVSGWSPNVIVITSGDLDPKGLENLHLLGIPVIRDEVTGVVHRNYKLVGVTTKNGIEIPCDAAWIAMGWKAGSGLAASLCEVDANGIAKVDLMTGKTSRPGVFAVGNASNPIGHLAHATAEGTNVGPQVANYLLELRLRHLEKKASGS